MKKQLILFISLAFLSNAISAADPSGNNWGLSATQVQVAQGGRTITPVAGGPSYVWNSALGAIVKVGAPAPAPAPGAASISSAAQLIAAYPSAQNLADIAAAAAAAAGPLAAGGNSGSAAAKGP